MIESAVCDASVNYTHRVDWSDAYNFCPVPDREADLFLFLGGAAVLACFLFISSPKLAPVFALIFGAAIEVVVYSKNLGRIGNAFTLVLGTPPEILLISFLPPLLATAALDIDFFLFRKVFHHIITYAFGLVLATTAILTPVITSVLGFEKFGWTWRHAGLFVATLASTDALAVSALIKAAEGPAEITVLMEGESLFNDASSLVVFSVFLSAVQAGRDGGGDASPEILPGMALEIFRLSAGGALVGLILGWLTLRMLRVLRRSTRSLPHQLGLIQAMSYLSFYLSEHSPLAVSGVISVVVFGLYGASTSKFELANSDESPQMDAVQETLGVMFNGVVFVLGGATAANFLLRATPELHGALLQQCLVAVPVVYAAMFIVRALGVYCLNTLFSFWTPRAALPARSLPFIAWGGLRGALSLIMAMVVVASHRRATERDDDAQLARELQEEQITAQITFMTSCIVILTLVVNAPTLPAVLRWCGLLEMPPAKARMMQRAHKALAKHTKEAIEDLKHDEDELLRGVDWTKVRKLVDPESSRLSINGSSPTGTPQKLSQRGSSILRRALSPGLPSNIRALVEGMAGSSDDEEKYGPPTMLESVSIDPGDQAELDAAIQAALSSASARAYDDSDAPGPSLIGVQRALRSAHTSSSGGTSSRGRRLRNFASGQLVGVRRLTLGVLSSPEIEEGWWSATGTSEEEGAHDVNRPLLAHPVPAEKDLSASIEGLEEGEEPSSPLDPLRPTESDLGSWWAASGGVESSASAAAAAAFPAAAAGAEGPSAEEVAESRARLVAGLKRYAFAKRAEGLLSAQGARLLSHACDAAIANAEQPLALWDEILSGLGDRWGVRIAASVFHNLRRVAYALPPRVQTVAVPMVKASTAWARAYLGTAMLRSCEVAVAYFMALSYSNQSQWLRQVGRNSVLLEELNAESAKVSRFVVDREIEAPSQFQAIQTYRAAMAVLRRQSAFVAAMFAAGVIDDGEKDRMAHPIEAKSRALVAAGPARWGWPRAGDVLAGLPFFSELAPATLDRILRVGTLREFAGGDVVWSKDDEEGRGPTALAIVVRGLVQVSTENDDGTAVATNEHTFLGSGSVLGLLPCISSYRSQLPTGAAPAIARKASHLQKGVLVFNFSKSLITEARIAAAAGNAESKHMLTEMHREAALYVLEAMRTSAVRQLARDWEVAAIERERELAAAAHRAAAEAVAGGDAGASPDVVERAAAAAGEAAVANVLLNSKELWTHATLFGQRTVAIMRRRLRKAAVVQLAPYQRYHQRSHIVLLAGAVQAQQTGARLEGPHMGMVKQSGVALAMSPKMSAPAVLPLCTHLGAGSFSVNQPRDILSGHEGALLVVWPLASS